MEAVMAASPKTLACDGCGQAASAEHIAARLRRLELSTRFRPVHMGVLFVALAPGRPENEFYGPPQSRDFFDDFLNALEIPAPADEGAGRTTDSDLARLAEFQRRGYYLAYLSECPLVESGDNANTAIAKLSPTLIRRIRFNYKPRLVAPLGQEIAPLVEVLRAAEVGPILTPSGGQVLPVPGTGAREWTALFQGAVAGAAPR